MEIDKTYDGRGIDTGYERSKIEYSPDISYIREHKPSDGEFDTKGYEVSNDVETFLKYSPSKTLGLITRTKNKYKKILGIIEERLKDDVVTINTEKMPEEKIEIINNFCEGPRITFPDYKRALNDENENSKVVALAYEEAHVEVTEKLEALMYRPMLTAKQEMDVLEESLLRQAQKVITFSARSELEKKEQQLASDWRDAQLKNDETYENFKSAEAIRSVLHSQESFDNYEESLSHYKESSKKYLGYSLNTLPALSQAYYKRAEQSATIADKSYNLLMYTLADSFHGMVGAFIKKVVRLHGDDPLKEKEAIQNAINVCEVLKKIIRLIVVSLSLESLKEIDILTFTTNAIIRQILPEIISDFTEKFDELVKPAINFLEDAAFEQEVHSDGLLSFDLFAEEIVNAISAIERRFKDILMDFYRTGMGSVSQGKNLLETLERRKNLSAAYKILDRVSMELTYIASQNNAHEFVLDNFVMGLVSKNGWDFSYNPQTDKIEKINSLLENNY